MSKSHVYEVKGSHFCVPEFYKIEKLLGSGAYGCVVEALDTRNNTKVAIKKISSLFNHLEDSKRTLREISILKYLQEHENLVKILDVFVEKSRDFDEIYIVFDYMQSDLHKICSSKQPLTGKHIQYFLYQILRGMKYLHSASVIHRDLKPANLLVNSDCSLEICDLGLSRIIDEKAAEAAADLEHSMYVATRWYRAPEIILGDTSYNKAVDVWSIGCIFAELAQRKPFLQGSDYVHQLHLSLEVSGTPEDSVLKKICNQAAYVYVSSLPKYPKQNLVRTFPMLSTEGVDLLQKMLEIDPTKRITVEQALAHPYLSSLHDEEEEVSYDGIPIKLFFEDCELTRELLEFCFLLEASHYRPKDLKDEVISRGKKLNISPNVYMYGIDWSENECDVEQQQ